MVRINLVNLCFNKVLEFYYNYINLEILLMSLLIASYSGSYIMWGPGLVIGQFGTGLVPGYVSEDIAQFIMYSTMILFIVRWVCLRYFPTRIVVFDVVTLLWFLLAFYRWYTIAQVGIQISHVFGLFWLSLFFFVFLRKVFKHYWTKNSVTKVPSGFIIVSLFEEVMVYFMAIIRVLSELELQVRDKRPKISLFLHENLGFDLWSVGLGMYCIQSFIFFGSCYFWFLLFWCCFLLCTALYAFERNQLLPANMLSETWLSERINQCTQSLCEERGIVFFRSSEIVQGPNGIAAGGGVNVGDIGGGNNAGGNNWKWRSARMQRGVVHFVNHHGAYASALGMFGIGAGIILGVLSSVRDEKRLSLDVQRTRDIKRTADAYNELVLSRLRTEQIKQRFLSSPSYDSQLASELADNSESEVKSSSKIEILVGSNIKRSVDPKILFILTDSQEENSELVLPKPPFERIIEDFDSSGIEVDTSEYSSTSSSTSSDNKFKGKIKK